MPTRSLTAAVVKRIHPPANRQVEYFDKGYPGLAMRVSYGGRKSWVSFYRLQGGKLRQLTLGCEVLPVVGSPRNRFFALFHDG